MAMPPPGPGAGAPPAAGAPPEGKPQPTVAQVAEKTFQGLQALAQAMAQAPQIPPEAKERMAEIAMGFKDLMSSLAGGGQGPQGGPGAAAPEAGGNPNARPMMPGG